MRASVYEAAGVKLDCLGADKASESCEPFDTPVAELRESGGTYVDVESSLAAGRQFTATVTITRASGASTETETETETETLDGVLVARTAGVCVLKTPATRR